MYSLDVTIFLLLILVYSLQAARLAAVLVSCGTAARVVHDGASEEGARRSGCHQASCQVVLGGCTAQNGAARGEWSGGGGRGWIRDGGVVGVGGTG